MPSMQFKGKTLVENFHLSAPYHALKAVPGVGLSRKPSLDDNLIVHGDNLLALKALLPTYHGRVKCVYIDPPYNIGSEGWAYNDNVNSPMMREWLGKVVDADDLTRHDKWCCMMLPRLKLLRELLRDDGAIFVSIDDNEVHRLRLLMDEVFGEENFVGSFVWEGTGKNDARFISVGHDYVLCYARRMESLHETDHQVLTSVFYQDRRAAHQRLVRILPDARFEYPKDERVLQRLFEAVTSDDDIILDSFAGAGSTAHAVLALNKHDGGNRRFVLIECEDYAEEITAQRVRAVIKGVRNATDEHLKRGLGGTFSYFALGDALQRRSLLPGKKLPSWEKLAGYVFFTATGEPFDPAKANQERWLAGKGSRLDVYLIYSERVDELQDLALNKSLANKLGRGKRPKVVFSPTKYVDADYLRHIGVAWQQLPFEIYERIEKLAR